MEERRRLLREQMAPILAGCAAFDWEIGCGHGHFLTAYARAHPARVCVGIDIASERIERALRKRERASLPNLHFIQAEAQMFLEVLAPEVRLAAIYILFPDPWPKKRHHKNRLMQPGFLQSAARRAERGARLFFRTDHRPYFEHTCDLLGRHPDWQIDAIDAPWPFEQPTVFQNRAPTFYSLTASVRQP